MDESLKGPNGRRLRGCRSQGPQNQSLCLKVLGQKGKTSSKTCKKNKKIHKRNKHKETRNDHKDTIQRDKSTKKHKRPQGDKMLFAVCLHQTVSCFSDGEEVSISSPRVHSKCKGKELKGGIITRQIGCKQK